MSEMRLPPGNLFSTLIHWKPYFLKTHGGSPLKPQFLHSLVSALVACQRVNGSTGPGSNRQSGLGGQDQGTRWADVIGEWREWRKFPSLEDSDGLASQQTRWFLSGLSSQSNQMVTVASSMIFHGYPWRSVSSSRR
jgi:hypothetical protein